MLTITSQLPNSRINLDDVITAMIDRCDYLRNLGTNLGGIVDPITSRVGLHMQLFADSTLSGDMRDTVVEIVTYYEGFRLVARHDSDPEVVKRNWLIEKYELGDMLHKVHVLTDSLEGLIEFIRTERQH